MGVLSSFNIGITGLKAAGQSMSVIGDNIANAGTFGYKSSRAEFQDLLSKSLKGIDGGDQIGSGTKLAHVTPLFTQGSINRTDNITDLAIHGQGFFVIDSKYGRGYTRDGTFRFDKEGNMITADEEKVLGFQVDDEGQVTNKLGAIKLGATTVPAKSTKQVKIMMNLDSRDTNKEFNIEDPEKTSTYQSSVTVFDNVGTERLIHLYFNKVDNNKWQYHAAVDGKDAEGGEVGKMVEMGRGTIMFNDRGLLQEVTEDENSFNFNKGAKPDQKVKFNFGATIAEGGNGMNAATQYGSRSSISRHTQDGHSAATLASLSFNDNGILTASYDNGTTKDLAQIAVAKFENTEALMKMGRNLFKETRKSGQAAVGKPNFDGRGNVLSKSLELSNVDVADEFINLMNAQRNFQANTRTITTADQMLQELLGIKR
ncbi:MAG: flagellar hook protein FlgE [Halobacteriovoraceae bacterium]|nr:flagellar hook protein FlgE [Halobacteriovoraceae bacterium]MCB9095918.1 flagellar hook protein FlgE [Halobacteriovoraceae bacterium]